MFSSLLICQMTTCLITQIGRGISRTKKYGTEEASFIGSKLQEKGHTEI